MLFKRRNNNPTEEGRKSKKVDHRGVFETPHGKEGGIWGERKEVTFQKKITQDRS